MPYLKLKTLQTIFAFKILQSKSHFSGLFGGGTEGDIGLELVKILYLQGSCM